MQNGRCSWERFQNEHQILSTGVVWGEADPKVLAGKIHVEALGSIAVFGKLASRTSPTWNTDGTGRLQARSSAAKVEDYQTWMQTDLKITGTTFWK